MTQRWFAVKNITTGVLVQAERECQVADFVRQKPHPCIVRLYHVHHYPDVGLYTLVMEFCPKLDLYYYVSRAKIKAMRERKPYVAPPQWNFWLGQIFLGLEHMHLRMGTLFRDLKLQNVVVDGQQCAKITDFGFSRFGLQASGQFSFFVPPGTAGYVAPEVLRKEEYDFRADLYSFGVVIWLLLTGGLKQDWKPRPPGVRYVSGQQPNYTAHFQDYQLLADCILRPAENGARRLDRDTTDFLLRLLHRQQAARPTHQEIRRSRLLERPQLPEFGAKKWEVEAWLKDVAEFLPEA